MSIQNRFKSLSPAWLIGSLVLLTLILRLPLLTGSFWMDEAAQIIESMRPWSQQLQIRDDFQPPFLHILTFFTRQISTTEWWLRLWGAVIPSLIVTWAMLQLLEQWWPKTTALWRRQAVWLGLLLATNSLWVFYSQELRPYSLAVMWSALSWWAIAKLVHRSGARSQLLTWSGWVLTALGGLYSTYLFPFVLVSQGLYLLWQAWQQPKLWKGLIGASLAVGLGFAPWIPSFLGQIQAGQKLRGDLPGWDQLVSNPQLKTLPLTLGKFLFGVVDLELNALYLGLTVLLVGIFTWLGWRVWRQAQTHQVDPAWKNTQSAMIFFAWWVIVPTLLAWLVSFKIPVIQPKRILVILPAVYALVVIIATHTNLRWLKLQVGQLALGALLLINIWSLSEYWRQPNYQREDWRELHAQLLQLYPPEKTLAVFAFGGPFAGWEWYDANTYPQLSVGYLTQPEKIDLTDQLKTASDTYTYIFVFEYLEPLTDPYQTVKASLRSLGWKEIGSASQPGIGFVRIYAKPSNLLGLTTSSHSSLSRERILRYARWN